MVEIIEYHRETIDEFQGDGILAFFGAPLAGSDDPERAIACAIQMQAALVDINAEQRQRGLPALVMGIGIHLGEVIVGNIGSEQRAKYGAVGSPINIVYRIESYTVGGQILISPSVYERVAALVGVRDTLAVQFKGLSQPMALYDVGSLQGTYACALPDKMPRLFTTLVPPLPVTCFSIEGKTVSATALEGYVIGLAATAAQVQFADQIPLHTNLQCLFGVDATPLSAVYAKVLAVAPRAQTPAATLVSIEFTAVPEDTKAFLEQHRTKVLPPAPASTA